MKIWKLICITTVGWFTSLRTEIGCMDNSNHLQQSYDHKTYHYVACDCPCKQYKHYFDKGYRCSKCQHAHDPKIMEAVRATYNSTAENYPSSINLRMFCPVKKTIVSKKTDKS